VTRFAMRLSYMCSSWAPWKTRVVTTDLAAPVRSTAAPKPRGSRAPLVALLLGTAGVVYRVGLTALEVPPTNSDEGTMGLAALHVLHAGEHPAFFYGQHYMGTLEAYLALPLVALTGPTVVALRLPAIVLYAAFLWLMYRLTTRLYPRPWFAVAVVGLLALGSDRVLKNEVIAAGGYPEINTAGAALLLLAIGLALGGGRRLARFAAWGLVAGLMLWDD